MIFAYILIITLNLHLPAYFHRRAHIFVCLGNLDRNDRHTVSVIWTVWGLLQMALAAIVQWFSSGLHGHTIKWSAVAFVYKIALFFSFTFCVMSKRINKNNYKMKSIFIINIFIFMHNIFTNQTKYNKFIISINCILMSKWILLLVCTAMWDSILFSDISVLSFKSHILWL